jgi:LacI family transcriptional regulator
LDTGMSKGSKQPTINDVAAMAGVSKRTVSRVINASDKVNKATRSRVMEVIKQLNFTPNRQARGLAASRSYLIGLVYEMPTLFISDIQKGVLGVCQDTGYELVVHACHTHTGEAVSNIVKFVTRARVDGVIVCSPVSEIAGLEEALENVGCDYIRFTSTLGKKPGKRVVTDYLPAISDMTRHLVEFGHQEFGFISGPQSNISARKRQESFIRALADYDLELRPELIASGAFTFDSGLQAARELLSRTPRPTAIFAANDEMAFGVMNVAAEMGLKIPEDLSVVGFDGTPFSIFVVPSLSTIIRKTDEMSRLAMLKLLALINEGTEGLRNFDTLVSPKFIPRESTGPAPGKQRR